MVVNYIGVPRTETGIVRLFAVGEQISFDGLKALLSASHFDTHHVDLLNTDDFGDGGLVDYLIEGMGISADQINADQVNALTGWVALVRSAAFRGRAQSLTPVMPVRLIGEYEETRGPRARGVLRSLAARRSGGRAAPSDKAMSGRVAMVALVLALLLVGVMLWIA